MKISKLFHWLYATLMLLPVVLIPVFMIYSHRHAVADGVPVATAEVTNVDVQSHVQYNYKYQTNTVNSLNDLVVGNLYHCDYIELIWDEFWESSYELDFYLVNFDSTRLDWNGFEVESMLSDGTFDVRDCVIHFTYNYFEDEPRFLELRIIGGSDTYFNLTLNSYTNWFDLTDFDFYCTSSYALDNLKYWFSFWEVLPEASTFNVIQSASVVIDDVDVTATASIDYEDSTITNVFFNQFADSVNNNPLISWASSSFFSAPFYYIADVFGLQHSNPICTLLSYWFSISVIWLVFDIFIYVPLLVHRWLDKASIE